jgi:cell division protein FtsL
MSMHRDNLARPLQSPESAPQHKPMVRPKTTVRKARLNTKEKLKWLGTIAFCIAIALCLVGRYASMVSLNYALEEKKVKLQDLKDQNLKAEQKVLELEAPDRIKGFAANKLGMKVVGDRNIVVLPEAKR